MNDDVKITVKSRFQKELIRTKCTADSLRNCSEKLDMQLEDLSSMIDKLMEGE